MKRRVLDRASPGPMRIFTKILAFFFALMLWHQVGAAILCSRQGATGLSSQGAGFRFCGADVCQKASPAQRIISLAPSLTKILIDLGAGDRIVGGITGANLGFPVIASVHGIAVSRVLELRPDLIVTLAGMSTTEPALTLLKKEGIPVYEAPQGRIFDIQKTIQDLGCLTGEMQKAQVLSLAFAKKFQDLKGRYGNQQPKIRVFYELWNEPLLTLNQDSLINQAIQLCGGVNIFAKTLGSAPEVSLSQVLLQRPQVIILSTNNWKKMWYSSPSPAAAQGHLFVIKPDALQQPTPEFLDVGVSQLCSAIETSRRGNHDTTQ